MFRIKDKSFYNGEEMPREDKEKLHSLMLRYWKGMLILLEKLNLTFMLRGILVGELRIR